MSYSLPGRDPIECGIAGETFEIDYQDTEGKRTARVVVAEVLYVSYGAIYLDAFCCLRGETRTFALDRVHRVRELSQSGMYESMRDWLASFGVATDVEQRFGRWSYRLRGSTFDQSSGGRSSGQ